MPQAVPLDAHRFRRTFVPGKFCKLRCIVIRVLNASADKFALALVQRLHRRALHSPVFGYGYFGSHRYACYPKPPVLVKRIITDNAARFRIQKSPRERRVMRRP